MFISHPLIQPGAVEHRDYQVNIASSALQQSTLVVLPTGLGKTVIALLVIAKRLERNPNTKVLFLAPTKPLVEQHKAFLHKRMTLSPDEINIFTGEVAPKKRLELWNKSRIIVSTPQVIVNELLGGRLGLENVGLIIFDEAHRAVGDYDYTFIGEKYHAVENGLVLGITASPGSEREKISEICRNLNIKKVETRDEHDIDVINYVQDTFITRIEVEPPAGSDKLIAGLRELFDAQLNMLRNLGYLQGKGAPTIKDLLAVGQEIRAKIAAQNGERTDFTAATHQAIAIKLNHALELVETQGYPALNRYIERLCAEAKGRGTRASKWLYFNPQFQTIARLSRELAESKEHPKLPKTVEIVKSQLERKPDSRIIVFTQYRDTNELVVNELLRNGIKAVRFIGQAKRGEDKGLKQKEQVELIEKFRNGYVNVLVCTSVGEEGLDIPATDLVVFYEPVPSEIRTIQRRGRTGRLKFGRVIILVTRGTRDSAYYWVSRTKERRMRSEIGRLRAILRSGDIERSEPEKNLSETKPGTVESVHKTQKSFTSESGAKQLTLTDFTEKKAEIRIIVDSREFSSAVVKELARLDCVIENKTLPVGDYIVSDRVGIERKNTADFLNSIFDGRLFMQMKELAAAFMRPVLVIEGEDLFTKRQLNPTMIYGALASVVTDFDIPVFFTRDAHDTAQFLVTLAKREMKTWHPPSIRGEKRIMSTQEQLQFIVEGIPGISSVMARRLLAHFGTIQAIANASVEQLREVEGIGKQRAEEIARIFREKYLQQ